MNHKFLLRVVQEKFKSHDFGSAREMLFHDFPADHSTVLYDVDEKEIIERLKAIIKIKETSETQIEVEFQNADAPVTLKTESFSVKMMFAFLKRKAEKILKNNESVRNLATKTLTFTKKLGNVSFLKKWFVDVPAVCDMLIDSINGVYKNTPYSSLVTVTVALNYILSPVDFIVDTFPVLGVADDAMVFKIVLDTTKNDLASYKTWKENQNAA